MLIKKRAAIPSSEITPRATYLSRRNFLAGAAIAAAVSGVAFRDLATPALTAHANTKIDGLQKSPFSTSERKRPTRTSPPTTISTNSPPRKMSRPTSQRISRPVPGP
jgi:hypothetical protein